MTYSAPEDSPWALVLFTTDDGGRSWSPYRVLSGLQGHGGVLLPSAVADSAWVTADATESTLTLTVTALGRTGPVGGEPSRASAALRNLSPPVSELSFVSGTQGWVMAGALLTTSDRGTTWQDISPWRRKAGVAAPPVAPPTAGPAPEALSSPGPLAGGGGGGSPTHTSVQIGFDQCAADTVLNMQTWWTFSPYHDTNVYIGGLNRACSQKNLSSTWVTKVTGQGWGLMPLWVGAQAPCACDPNLPGTCPPFPDVFSTVPSVASSQAIAEADNAASVAASLGLGKSVIYYDLEYYDPTIVNSGTTCGSAANAFVSAWVNELHLDGYVAAVYGSPLDAGDWWTMTTYRPDDVWIARYDGSATVWGLAHGLSSADAISDTEWTNNQRAHQYTKARNEKWGGVTFNIDIDIEGATVAGGQGAKTFSTYSFTTIDYPGSAGTDRAAGVNDAGGDLTASVDQIVGVFGNSGGFLDTNGTFSSITCSGANLTNTFDINNLGHIVGIFAIPNSNAVTSFIYINGSCVPFNFSGISVAYAYGVNDDDQVVGTYNDSNGNPHRYFYNYGGDGSFISFDYPGAARGTVLTGINGQGQIAGHYADSSGNIHSFLWNHASDGSLVPINHSGASSTQANDINANGQVVGTYSDSKGIHTFLWSNGSFSSFPNDPSACTNCTYGIGINNYGRVVGQYNASAFSEHGFWAVPSP